MKLAVAKMVLAGEGPSVRELEVLTLMADGLSLAQIALKLEISYDTVRTHVAHATKKLGARTRVETVAIVLRNGLIE